MNYYFNMWDCYMRFFNKGMPPKQYGIMLSKKRGKNKRY